MPKSRTKDESYILKLYEVVSAHGGLSYEVDLYKIGESIGMSYRMIETITNGLSKANFIKKIGGSMIRLTPNGESLAQTLLEQ